MAKAWDQRWQLEVIQKSHLLLDTTGMPSSTSRKTPGLPWGDLCEHQVSTSPSLAPGTLPGSPFLTQALDPQRLKVLMAYHQETPQVLHDGGEVGQQGGLGSRG